MSCLALARDEAVRWLSRDVFLYNGAAGINSGLRDSVIVVLLLGYENGRRERRERRERIRGKEAMNGLFQVLG